MPNLCTLHCRNVPDAGVGLVLDSCPNLAECLIFGCSHLTGLSLYGNNNTGLKLLGLGTNITAAPASAAAAEARA